MRIIITPESKTTRNYRVGYALSGLTLFAIFGPGVIGFKSLFTLTLFLESLAPIFLGIGAGLLLFKSIFNINSPVILIDESEIQSKHSYWTRSFTWKRLKQVSLFKNRIELTYRQTELTDSIKLPFLIRSRSPEIHDALKEMCSKNNIGFAGKYPFQRASNRYGFQNNY